MMGIAICSLVFAFALGVCIHAVTNSIFYAFIPVGTVIAIVFSIAGTREMLESGASSIDAQTWKSWEEQRKQQIEQDHKAKFSTGWEEQS